MRTFASFPVARRAFAAGLIVIAGVAAWAQQGPAAPPSSAAAASGLASVQASTDSKANDEWLARASKLYYSTKQARLNGFDCDVHPDWHALFSSSNPGAALPDDDPHIVTLKEVKIALHARMSGGSTMDWARPSSPDKPLDAETTAMLDQLRQATEQTLMGFMQFWTPFVDGSVVPTSGDGLTIARSANDWTLRGAQNGAEVTEVFSNQMILQHFDVVTNGMSIKFAPSYQSTEMGLLVTRFDAHIQAVGQESAPAQEMHVLVTYAQVDGLPIPSKVNIDVVGTGTFNMAMDGCRTKLAAK